MRIIDLACNRVLLHALNLGWKSVPHNKIARRHFRWEGPEELRISLYKGIKDLDYTVGHFGTTNEDHAIKLLDDAAFIGELEKRSMSDWSDEEMARYSFLTGQAKEKP